MSQYSYRAFCGIWSTCTIYVFVCICMYVCAWKTAAVWVGRRARAPRAQVSCLNQRIYGTESKNVLMSVLCVRGVPQ